MEERFRPLTFHGLVLRSQLVTLLVRGVCYSESQSVSLGPGVLQDRKVMGRPCCSGRGGLCGPPVRGSENKLTPVVPLS